MHRPAASPGRSTAVSPGLGRGRTTLFTLDAGTSEPSDALPAMPSSPPVASVDANRRRGVGQNGGIRRTALRGALGNSPYFERIHRQQPNAPTDDDTKASASTPPGRSSFAQARLAPSATGSPPLRNTRSMPRMGMDDTRRTALRSPQRSDSGRRNADSGASRTGGQGQGRGNGRGRGSGRGTGKRSAWNDEQRGANLELLQPAQTRRRRRDRRRPRTQQLSGRPVLTQSAPERPQAVTPSPYILVPDTNENGTNISAGAAPAARRVSVGGRRMSLSRRRGSTGRDTTIVSTGAGAPVADAGSEMLDAAARIRRQQVAARLASDAAAARHAQQQRLLRERDAAAAAVAAVASASARARDREAQLQRAAEAAAAVAEIEDLAARRGEQAEAARRAAAARTRLMAEAESRRNAEAEARARAEAEARARCEAEERAVRDAEARMASIRTRKRQLLARKAQLQRRRREQRQNVMATRIQSLYRGCAARVRTSVRREQHHAAKMIQKHVRRRLAMAERHRRHNMRKLRHRSAARIQARQRGIVARMKHEQRVIEYFAAVSIQAHVRRRAALRVARQRRVEKLVALKARRLQASVRDSGGIPLLIGVLRDGSARARANAAGALEQLAHANDDNQVAIREEGGVTLLIGLIRYATAWYGADDSSSVIDDEGAAMLPATDEQIFNDAAEADEAQRKCVCCLSALGADTANRACVREEGGLPVVLALLTAATSSDALREATARCLWSLLLERTTQDELGRPPLQAEVALLAVIGHGGSLAVRSAAAAALSQLTWQHRHNQDTALQAGAALVLAQLLGVRTEVNDAASLMENHDEYALVTAECEARANAATAVQALTHNNSEGQARIRESGAIPHLVTMLNDTTSSTGSESQREAAAAALWNLAIDEGARVAIGDEGGAPLVASLLVPLLDDGGGGVAGAGWGQPQLADEATRINACASLRRMAASSASNRRAVRDAGAVGLLSRLLIYGDQTIRAAAASVLVVLAVEDELSDHSVEQELAEALEMMATAPPPGHALKSQTSHGLMARNDQGYSAGGALAQTVTVPDQHVVRVRVAGARNLVATDKALALNSEGKMARSADPYLVVHVGDERGGEVGQIERRTQVAKRTRRPKWEEVLTFGGGALIERPSTLTVTCMGFDPRKKDTVMGTAQISLDSEWVHVGTGVGAGGGEGKGSRGGDSFAPFKSDSTIADSTLSASLDDAMLKWYPLTGVRHGEVHLAIECTVRKGGTTHTMRAMDESHGAPSVMAGASGSAISVSGSHSATLAALAVSIPLVVSLCSSTAPIVTASAARALWRISSWATAVDTAPGVYGGDGGAGWQIIRDSKAVPVFVGVFAAVLAAADDCAKASTSHAVGSAAVSMAAAVAQEGGTSAANLLKQWWRAALNAAGALEQLCTFGQQQVQSEVLHCGGIPLLLEIACDDGSRVTISSTARQRLNEAQSLLASDGTSPAERGAAATAAQRRAQSSHTKVLTVREKQLEDRKLAKQRARTAKETEHARQAAEAARPPSEVRGAMLRALAVIVDHPECQEEVRAHALSPGAARLRFGGGIPGLTQLLHSENLELVEGAASVLGQLGWNNNTNQEAVQEAHALGPLVDLLRDDTVETYRAVGAEDDWADDAADETESGTASVCAGLSISLSCRTAAATALWKLSQNTSNQDEIRASGGIDALLVMLRLRRETRAERRLRLAGPQGAAKAASAIEVEGAISAAAGALADLCWNNAQNQGSLRDQGGLQLVLSLCKHRSPGVRAVVTRLLWNCVADNAQNRDVVLAEDGLNLIVQLLSDPNDEIQANAAGAMESLMLQQQKPDG